MNLSKPAIITAAVLGTILVLGLWLSGNYNSLVGKKAEVENSWSKVETQYQRRLDLIDNVVASVKGAQGQEVAVIGQITDARRAYGAADSTEDKAAAASSLETNIALLPRLQEAYPDLKSNTQVTALINELGGTENTIAGVRNDYNDKVTGYNVGISRFPGNIFANLFDFDRAKLFQADSGASKAPTVKFGAEATPNR